MFKKLAIFLSCLIFATVSFASTKNSEFVADKDYKIIPSASSKPQLADTPKGKVSVVEFFNYGCPWCFHLETALENWLKTKPSDVYFTRVPVVFESGWQIYAKAYYTAKALGVENKMTPLIFKAIHKEGLNLMSASRMQKFFVENGVNKSNFESAFDFSPGIGMELQRSNELMSAYQVYQIPTIIVAGKYLTNSALANGNDKRMMQIVSYLVKKAGKQ